MVHYERTGQPSTDEEDIKPLISATSSFMIKDGKPRVYTGLSVEVKGKFPHNPNERISRTEIIQKVAELLAEEIGCELVPKEGAEE